VQFFIYRDVLTRNQLEKIIGLYSSKLDFELGLRYGLSQLKAQVGLAAATADGLTNDTVRDLCCPHPCGEHEKGKEKERRKKEGRIARSAISPYTGLGESPCHFFKCAK